MPRTTTSTLRHQTRSIVENLDDDTAGLTVTQSENLSVVGEAGLQDTLTVLLEAKPIDPGYRDDSFFRHPGGPGIAVSAHLHDGQLERGSDRRHLGTGRHHGGRKQAGADRDRGE